jgi:hypothetical protein
MGSSRQNAAMSLSIASTSSLFQSASTMINRASAAVNKSSATVASATDVTDVLPAMIDARQQVLYTQAAAKMISTGNAMIGSLLDTMA